MSKYIFISGFIFILWTIIEIKADVFDDLKNNVGNSFNIAVHEIQDTVEILKNQISNDDLKDLKNKFEQMIYNILTMVMFGVIILFFFKICQN